MEKLFDISSMFQFCMLSVEIFFNKFYILMAPHFIAIIALWCCMLSVEWLYKCEKYLFTSIVLPYYTCLFENIVFFVSIDQVGKVIRYFYNL